jgi:hypothetical protein
MPTKREWTLMFYLASDNPLAPGIVSQLKSIKAAGFHKEANVIVQFDPFTENTPTHVFDVNVIRKALSPEDSNIGFRSNDPFVHNLLEDRLWRDEKDRNGVLIRNRLIEKYKAYNPGIPPNGKSNERHSEPGPQESLNAFLEFCADAYPANHYILFILGHGVVIGNEVFLFDEHADEQTLSLGGLRQVLENFNKRIKKQEGTLEMVSFHSCSVSSLEVAYELKDYARYMLASQGTTFIGSWPYRQILIRIFNSLERKEGTDPKTIEDMLGNIFDYCFHNSTDFLLAGYPFDLCLCDLARISETRAAVELLSRALIRALGSPAFEESILMSHLKSQSFHQEMYTDIVDFCRCLFLRTETSSDNAETELIRTGVQDACRDVVGAIKNSIVRVGFAGPEYQYSKGLSLYFPWSQPLDEVLEKYACHKFIAAKAGEVTWLHFLKAYFDKTRRDSFREEFAKPIEKLGERSQRAESIADELLEDELAQVYTQSAPQINQVVGGSLQKTDKTDPMGDDCSCPSIKNYPRDTRRRRERREKPGPVPVDATSLMRQLL